MCEALRFKLRSDCVQLAIPFLAYAQVRAVRERPPLRRVERARRYAEANPGPVDERELSLGWQYTEVMKGRRARP
jgi:hypothetical protein